MTTQEHLIIKLNKIFNPTHLEVINESKHHSVPAGSESHFKVVIVSKSFEGKKLIERQRAVNATLATELKEKIHALTMTTLTPEEWTNRGEKVEPSPPCFGGSKKS